MAKTTGKKKKQQISAGAEISLQFLEYVLAGLLITLFLVVPLYLKQGYYQVGEAKFAAYKYIMLIGCGALFIFLIMYLIFEWKDYMDGMKPEKLSVKGIVSKWSVTDWFVIAYMISVILSVFAGGFYDRALWGYPGWYMGFMAQFSFVCLYFFVSRYGTYAKNLLWVLGASSLYVFVLGILHRLWIDPPGYYEGISEFYRSQFLSTLGQNSWYGSFMVTVLPIGIFLFIYCNNIKVRIVSGIYVFIGFCTWVTQNSDSAYFALVGWALVLFWFAVKDIDRLIYFFVTLILFFLAGKVMQGMLTLKPNPLITFDVFSQFVIYSIWAWVILGLLVIVLVGLLYLRKKNLYQFRIGRGCSVAVVCIVCIGIVLAILLIVLNSNGMLPQSISEKLSVISYFNWNELWGTGRGKTWEFTVSMYAQESLLHKLFGVGPDCFSSYAHSNYSSRLQEMWGDLVLTNAHNEWMTMLVCGGIFGAVTYLGIFISSIKRLAKNAAKEPFVIGICACIVAYMTYNVFCYQQVLCTPFVFILMGIGEYLVRTQREE